MKGISVFLIAIMLLISSVIALDTTKPVITLSGSTPIDVEIYSAYVDSGATALDDVDGDITSSIITVNPVDTSVLGTYTVTYNVVDSSGNIADEVTRTVNVVDTTLPVISVIGANTLDVEYNSVYTDSGASASDNYDGDLTSSIVTVNPVDTSVLGTYTVTYNVVDSNSNIAVEKTRTVNVVDTTLPVISVIGANTLDVEYNSVYTDLGASASDNYDGDLTSSIVTVNPVDTSVLGTYTVTYDVTDSNSNVATQKTRTVNVVDTTLPVISVIGANSLDVEYNSVYTDLGASASDNYDGDLTSSIVTVNPVDTSVLGTYTVTYDVTDSNSNVATQKTRTVNVVDTTLPVITLKGNSTVSITEGETYTDLGASALDSYDGNITSSIVVVNPVNKSKVGKYNVTYNVVDSSGNNAVEVKREVEVKQKPVEAVKETTKKKGSSSSRVSPSQSASFGIVIEKDVPKLIEVSNAKSTVKSVEILTNTGKTVTLVTKDIPMPSFNIEKPKNALKYFEINTLGLDDSEIKEVKIRFNYDGTENIVLQRYHDSAWTILPTTKISENLYEALSPGFSTYSISKKEELPVEVPKDEVIKETPKEETTTTTEPVKEEIVNTETSSTENIIPEIKEIPKESKNKNMIIIGVSLLILITILVIGIMYGLQNKKVEPEE